MNHEWSPGLSHDPHTDAHAVFGHWNAPVEMHGPARLHSQHGRTSTSLLPPDPPPPAAGSAHPPLQARRRSEQNHNKVTDQTDAKTVPEKVRRVLDT